MTLVRWSVIAPAALVLVASAWAHGLSEEVDEIAALIGLRPGTRLADVGAGEGEFAEALAERVGTGGHVFVNEIDDGALRKIGRRIKRSELTNMTRVEGEIDDTNLPDGCCNGILLRYVYHHISEPAAMRSSLRRSLRPGGLLLVIEKLEPGDGISLGDLIDDFTGDGFRLVSTHPLWGGHDEHHAAVFAPLP